MVEKAAASAMDWAPLGDSGDGSRAMAVAAGQRQQDEMAEAAAAMK